MEVVLNKREELLLEAEEELLYKIDSMNMGIELNKKEWGEVIASVFRRIVGGGQDDTPQKLIGRSR